MATMEERVSALEEVLTDIAPPFRAIMVKLDDVGRDVREQGRDLHEQGRDLRELKMRAGTTETRINGMDEKIDAMRGELRQTNQKLDQVLALLTQGGTSES